MDKKTVSRIIDHFGEGRIGDVLQEIAEKNTDEARCTKSATLLVKWISLHLAKSLQQIVNESEWERKVFCACGEELKKDESHECRTIGKPTFTEQLKNPQARELLTFLNKLIK